MAGVDELTERDLDGQEAARCFGMEPEEQSEDVGTQAMGSHHNLIPRDHLWRFFAWISY